MKVEEIGLQHIKIWKISSKLVRRGLSFESLPFSFSIKIQL